MGCNFNTKLNCKVLLELLFSCLCKKGVFFEIQNLHLFADKGGKIYQILHEKGGIFYPSKVAWLPTMSTSRDAGHNALLWYVKTIHVRIFLKCAEDNISAEIKRMSLVCSIMRSS